MAFFACTPRIEESSAQIEAETAPPGLAASESALNISPSSQSSVSSVEAVKLEPGIPQDRKLASGDIHTYEVALQAGDFLNVEIAQNGADVIVHLFDPENNLLFDFDNLLGPFGSQDVLWRADSPGIYRFQIRAFAGSATGGKYTLTLQEPQQATTRDLGRAEATRLLREGFKRQQQGGFRALEDSLSMYEKAADLWNELGEREKRAHALLHIGSLFRQEMNEPEKALPFYMEAASVYHKVGNIRQEALTLHSIGLTSFALGRIETARASYEKALGLRQACGDLTGEMTTSNNLAMALNHLGESDRAIEIYDHALDLAIRTQDPASQASILHNRGRCYYQNGSYQHSLDDIQQALSLRRQLEDQHRLDSTLSSLGLAYSHRNAPGDLERALLTFKEGLSISKETGDFIIEAAILSNTGIVQEQLGQKTTALQSFKEALDIFKARGARLSEIITLNNIGRLLADLGRPDEALELHREALAMLRPAETPYLEITTRCRMASALHQTNNLESGLLQLEQATKLIENLRFKTSSPNLRSTHFAADQYCYDSYVDLLMDLHRQDPTAGFERDALSVAERARARTLLERIIENDSGFAASSPLRTRLLAIEREINAKESRRLDILEDNASSGQLESLELNVRELLREHDLIQAQIRQLNFRGEDPEQPSPLSADELQGQLPDSDTTILQYRLGGNRSFLWIIDKERITPHELAARDSIESVAKTTHRLLAGSNERKSVAPLELSLSRLSSLIIPQDVINIESKTLIIITDGALGYIPFGILPIPSDTGKDFLLNHYRILFAPSGSTVAAINREDLRQPRPEKTLAIIADPVFQRHDPRLRPWLPGSGNSKPSEGDPGNYERLVFSRQEADTIAQLVDSSEVFTAFDFQADRELLRHDLLSNYRIVHIATHGYLDTQRPELTRLIFSLVDENGNPKSGFLHSHEIYSLRLPVETVVLSACQTALGNELRGEGIVGLTQAFLHAGAKRVLVSLWQVNDRSTGELMAQFYRHLLKDGLEPAAALREAQLEIRREKAWHAPYFWAGFILQGVP